MMNTPEIIPQPRIVRLIHKTPVTVAFFVAMLFAGSSLVDFNKDTTALTNVATAVMAALSGLGFSFARVVGDAGLRERLMYGGERLLHGALFAASAAITKYAVLFMKQWTPLADHPLITALLTSPLQLAAHVGFLYSIFAAHSGLVILNDHSYRSNDQAS